MPQHVELLNGRYLLQNLIGEGGMGAVYRAFDTLYDKPCAIKEFRLGYLPSSSKIHTPTDPDLTKVHSGFQSSQFTREQAVEQFKQEAKLLVKLSHPNLPQVTDYFGVGDNVHLAMTLIEGKNLATILEEEKNRPLPVGQVLSWMNQVLDALAYCHQNHVIHRDVKPANIIVTSEGKVYLVDFGIARLKEIGDKTLAAPPAATTGYSPPEQYDPDGHTDVRSDIYSLGATFYELLTGKPPPAALKRLTGKELPPPRARGAATRPEIDAVVLRALALDPSHRFQTIAQMRAALTDAMKPPSRARKLLLVLVPTAFCFTVAMIVLMASTLLNQPDREPGGGEVTQRGGGQMTTVPISVSPTKVRATQAVLLQPTQTRAPVKTLVPATLQETLPATSATPPRIVPTVRPSGTPTLDRIILYNPPTLQDPPDGRILRNNTILRWSSEHSLAPDEVFDVLVWRDGSESKTSLGRTRDKIFPIDFRLWGQAPGKYLWTVQIVQLNGIVLTETLPPRSFILTDE